MVGRVLVEEFPDDRIERIVYATGSIPITSDYVSNPLVNVFLVPAPWHSKTHEPQLIQIPIAELDVVRRGTVWRGKEKILYNKKVGESRQHQDFFEFNKYSKEKGSEETEVDFEIKVIPNESKIVKFGSQDNDGNYLIPFSYFSLPLNYNGQSRTKENANYLNQVNVKNSFCNVFTDNGIEYVIPCLEVFTALYAPMRKELRRMILTHTKEQIISKYIDRDSEDFKIGSDNQITLRLKENLGDSSAIFLAHLLLSDHTNKVFDEFKNSISSNENDHLNIRLESYFTGETNITGRGIWLNEEKSRLLVLRIESFQLPTDIQVNIIEKRKLKEPKEKPSNGSNQGEEEIEVTRTVVKKKKINITNKRPSGKSDRKNFVLSEVQTSALDGTLIRTVEIEYTETDEDEDESTYGKEKITVLDPSKEELINTSSGEKFTHQGPKVWTNEVKQTFLLKDPQRVPIDVFNAIIELNQKDDSFLLKIVNKDGVASSQIDDFKISYSNYHSIEENTWVLKNDKYREIILLQLYFEYEKFENLNSSMNYYLLEILRRENSSDSNTGYLIKLPYKLGSNHLRELLIDLADTQGRLDEKKDGSLKPFKHSKGGLTWSAKMKKTILEKFQIKLIEN